VAGSIAATIPSRTACRANSVLLQWVTCRPRAIGFRQASWTIWDRCRGGNPRRSPRALRGRDQPAEAVALVTTAGAPDGGRVALVGVGDCLNSTAVGDRQHDPGAADLEPGGAQTTGQPPERLLIIRGDRQRSGVSASHGGRLAEREGRTTQSIADSSISGITYAQRH